jgi:hypothetical protein
LLTITKLNAGIRHGVVLCVSVYVFAKITFSVGLRIPPFNPQMCKTPLSDLPDCYPRSVYLGQANGRGRLFFFNLHSGGWNQGPLDTAAT